MADSRTCGECKYLGQDCTDEEPGNRACPYFEEANNAG